MSNLADVTIMREKQCKFLSISTIAAFMVEKFDKSNLISFFAAQLLCKEDDILCYLKHSKTQYTIWLGIKK